MKENQTYRIFRKVATQAVNDTTQVAITSLVAPVQASETYKFKLSLLVVGKAADDVDVALTGPSGSTLTYGLSSVTPKVSVGAAEIGVALTDDLPSLIVIEGTIVVSTTAGNLTPTFAMTADVSTTPLTAQIGSCLEIWQVTDTT